MSGKEELHQLVERLPAGRVETARKVLGDLCGEPPSESNESPVERPIEEILKELAAGIPREEWDRLPADLTDHLDHYLYGTPRR
ncbi:MAG: hypothetical protein AAB225_00830 [Acidobacteriota bacterium]